MAEEMPIGAVGVVRVEVSAKDSVTKIPQATGSVSHRINRHSNSAVADHTEVHPAGCGSTGNLVLFPASQGKS